MPITVICGKCQKLHRVRDRAFGKQFKCKGCGKFLRVEAMTSPDGDLEDGDQQGDDLEEDEYKPLSHLRRSKSNPATTSTPFEDWMMPIVRSLPGLFVISVIVGCLAVGISVPAEVVGLCYFVVAVIWTLVLAVRRVKIPTTIDMSDVTEDLIVFGAGWLFGWYRRDYWREFVQYMQVIACFLVMGLLFGVIQQRNDLARVLCGAALTVIITVFFRSIRKSERRPFILAMVGIAFLYPIASKFVNEMKFP